MDTVTLASAPRPLGLDQDGFGKLVHDLRTPLTGVIGLAKLMRAGTCTSLSADELLELIQRSAQHMLGLVNDILDVGSGRTGTLALNPAPTVLDDVLTDVRAMTGPQACAKGLDLRLEADAGVPQQLVADRRRLTQVLTNLVSNAIDFTTTGQITVQLRRPYLQPADARRVAISFEVRDSGIGMTAEEASRIFLPYVQAAAGARRGGNGLGLAICRDLVACMGGHIAVESQPSAGSRFTFTLEFERTADDASTAPTPAAACVARSEICVTDDPASAHWMGADCATPRAAPAGA